MDSRWHEELRRRLASLGLSGGRETEIVEELSQHLEQHYQELIGGGAAPDEARRVTLAELLDPDTLAEQLRPLRASRTRSAGAAPARWPWLGDSWHDVRYAVRSWRSQPLFAAAAVLTLALGIGGTTAVFGVVYGVLIRPLPYHDPDALVRIVHNIGGIVQPYFSDAIFVAYDEHGQAFEDVGVWSPDATATITGQGDPEEVRMLWASRSLLTTLAVPPALGRWFTTAEDTRGAESALLVSHGYWQRRFGGESDAVGRSLIVDGRPHRIVGVMPEHFRFGGEFDILVPLRIDRARPAPAFRLVGVARARPGVTPEQMNADVMRVLGVWFDNAKVAPAVRARWVPALQPLRQDVIGDVGDTLWVLMAAVAVVLVMACANVTNLILVRMHARRHESAVRAALGASSWRMARQSLAESLMLSLVGGLLGVAIAYGGVSLIRTMAPGNLPRVSELSIDGSVLAFASGVSLLSGLLLGLVPTLRHARPKVAELAAGGRSATTARDRQRSQQTIVAAQVAFALVLLVSAGLMIRSFQALQRVEHGFTAPERLQTFSVSIPVSVVPEPEPMARMQQQLIERVAAIPGVTSAAFATRLPMGGDRASSALTSPSEIKRFADDETPPNRHVKIVSPGLFGTQGTPVIAGRDFRWADVYGGPSIAIVSRNLARQMFGTPQAAIGRRVREFYDKQAPWREIVGVVGDVHDDGADREAPETIYWPARPVERRYGMGFYQARRISVLIRTERAGTPALLEDLRRAVSSINPALPLADVQTLDALYGRSMARTAFTLVMLAIAGTTAVLLGLTGIYGVVSYAVSQRRREIGIRLALGAQRQEIRRMFVRRGVVVVGIGLAAGVGAAASVTRLLESLLFGVEPLDPVAFIAMPVVLAIAALVASYLPARQAMTVDPVETMRAE
jgi:predicted permease